MHSSKYRILQYKKRYRPINRRNKKSPGDAKTQMNDQINKTQEKIIEEFSKHTDWFDKYEYLIQQGKTLSPIKETEKVERNLIPGCQPQAWLTAEMNNKNIVFLGDSDSLLIKGMISLLTQALNNNQPEDMLNTDLYFIEKIGLSSHLSPSRVNGLMSIIKQMKSYAELAPNFK